ncbi:hypothetical protein [Flavobacterium sp. PL12]|uniref:hypothetical protein n=1 Tax=Flavobacterium sp. PL12 TaxID=3071718 RepID=UPI00319DFEFC
MKIQLIFFGYLFFFMVSCISMNDKSRITDDKPIIIVNDSISDKLVVINDFLDKKIKNSPRKIMLMSQKINTDMTLRILRVNDIYAVDSLARIVEDDKTFYKEEEWEKSRIKYSKNTTADIVDVKGRSNECCWTAGNFNDKNLVFEELNIGSTEFGKKYISNPNFYYYYFSEPIYYQNKEYLIFTIYDGFIFDGLSGSSKIIIYKKKNGKWIQTHEGLPNWFS